MSRDVHILEYKIKKNNPKLQNYLKAWTRITERIFCCIWSSKKYGFVDFTFYLKHWFSFLVKSFGKQLTLNEDLIIPKIDFS